MFSAIMPIRVKIVLLLNQIFIVLILAYSIHNSGFSDQTLRLDEFVIINCSTKGRSISVAWIEMGNDHNADGEKSKVAAASKADSVLTADSCCSVKAWNVSAKNPETLVARRWKNASKEFVACEGADVELFCNVTGSPIPQVQWRRKRDLFPGQSLVISNVQRQDNGTYWCEASNGAGAELRRDITLIVEFPPIITVPNKEVNSSSSEQECILQCVVEASPNPAITWYKEDIVLEQSVEEHYDITIQEMENSTTLTVLRVLIVNNGILVKSRFGNYTCKAENRHGTSAARLKLLGPFDVVYTTDEEEPKRKFNVTGFIIGMLPPIFISVYIIIKLGYRSRYAEERPEEDGVQQEPFFVSH